MIALSLAERAALLGIARAAVRHHLGLGPRPALPAEGALASERGAFVTLTAGEALRGCIGSFAPHGTLARTVADVAVSAASADPRFTPVRAEELDELRYRISALWPCEPMRDVAHVRIGSHGLLVKSGLRRGALLPGVALENGWDAPTFLKHTCLKAGLGPDAWRDPATTVEVFSAEEFGDGEEG